MTEQIQEGLPKSEPVSQSKETTVLDLAARDPSVPKVYANGFTMGHGNADVQILLTHQGRPVTHLSLSFTVAKTLFIKLETLVSNFEKRVGRQMLTTSEIDKAFKNSESVNKSDDRSARPVSPKRPKK